MQISHGRPENFVLYLFRLFFTRLICLIIGSVLTWCPCCHCCISNWSYEAEIKTEYRPSHQKYLFYFTFYYLFLSIIRLILITLCKKYSSKQEVWYEMYVSLNLVNKPIVKYFYMFVKYTIFHFSWSLFPCNKINR